MIIISEVDSYSSGVSKLIKNYISSNLIYEIILAYHRGKGMLPYIKLLPWKRTNMTSHIRDGHRTMMYYNVSLVTSVTIFMEFPGLKV